MRVVTEADMARNGATWRGLTEVGVRLIEARDLAKRSACWPKEVRGLAKRSEGSEGRDGLGPVDKSEGSGGRAGMPGPLWSVWDRSRGPKN